MRLLWMAVRERAARLLVRLGLYQPEKVVYIGGSDTLPSPLTLSLIHILGAFLFSVALGVIFGMYPAVKASGLQPVVALRAE